MAIVRVLTEFSTATEIVNWNCFYLSYCMIFPWKHLVCKILPPPLVSKILVLAFYFNLVSRISRIAFYAALGGGRMTLKGQQGCQQPTLAKEKRTQLDKRELYAPIRMLCTTTLHLTTMISSAGIHYSFCFIEQFPIICNILAQNDEFISQFNPPFRRKCSEKNI